MQTAAAAARSSRLLCLPPVLAALAAFSGALGGELVLEARRLLERREELERLDPLHVFLERYLLLDRADRGYRPLACATYALDLRLGGEAWRFRLTNVLLHAAAALLAFFLLRDLLGGAPLASLGASLYAVLPVHAGAVASAGGRPELLGGLLVLGAWLAALRSLPAGEPGRERPGAAAAAGLLTSLALLAAEGAGLAAPLLVLGGCWVLRRPVPRIALASAFSAALGYVVFRGALLEGQPQAVTAAENPLVAADLPTRLLNGARILGLHLARIAVPLGSGIDDPASAIEVLPATSPLGWLQAGVVLAALAGAGWAARQRLPLAALAVLVFAIALAPSLSLVAPAHGLFAERHAHLAALALALAACAALQALPGRRRRAGVLVLGVVAAAYGGAAWARTRHWASEEAAQAALERSSPGRARARFRSYEEAWNGARVASRRRDLRDDALALARWKLARDPADGWAEALLGRTLYHDGKHAEALEHLELAAGLLEKESPPEADPALHEVLAQTYVILGKDEQALASFDRHVRLVQAAGGRPDATLLSRRGLAKARRGMLREALADFDAALAARKDLADLWNNRGFCRFKLGDSNGAIEDYKEGFELTKRLGLTYAPSGDSAHAFVLRIADVYAAAERAKRQAGDAQGADAAAAEAARLRAQAQTLVPRKSETPR
ncbi:MAG: tetratricopeptide repeat protein [Planctomycetes bacterium]|nr:tetratricopeptide repeat protein [Planctomycetota bacterium]